MVPKTARKSSPLSAPAAGDPWLSLPKAQRLLGEGRHTILQRALRGEIRHQWVDGRLFLAREEVERDELLRLRLEQPGLEAGGHARAAELAQGALQFDEVHVGIASWVLRAMTSR